MRMTGTVYLIHFDRPLAHARHYLGWTHERNVDSRLARHRSGRGARLLAVLNEAGIRYHVVRVWFKVNGNFERQLKKAKGSGRFCPVCNPTTFAAWGVPNRKKLRNPYYCGKKIAKRRGILLPLAPESIH